MYFYGGGDAPALLIPVRYNPGNGFEIMVVQKKIVSSAYAQAMFYIKFFSDIFSKESRI